MKQAVKRQAFVSRDAWQAWLEANHTTAREMWLIFHKKHTGRAGLLYEDAVEEALCFGWIDGILKRIDGEKHMIRFSPRRKNSVWSERNKQRVRKLIKEGRMTEAGLTKVEQAKASGQWQKAAEREDGRAVPQELKEALAKSHKAREHFEKLAPSYRKHFIYWIGSAKRDEARRKRVAEAITLLAQGRKLGMK